MVCGTDDENSVQSCARHTSWDNFQIYHTEVARFLRKEGDRCPHQTASFQTALGKILSKPATNVVTWSALPRHRSHRRPLVKTSGRR